MRRINLKYMIIDCADSEIRLPSEASWAAIFVVRIPVFISSMFEINFQLLVRLRPAFF